MPNPYFSFKRFTVYHDKCAMKVGTDGVLLGAWTNVNTSQRILDIGTGSGLVALMLAQRCEGSITAIDIDSEAVEQAQININASNWKNRMEVIHTTCANTLHKTSLTPSFPILHILLIPLNAMISNGIRPDTMTHSLPNNCLKM